MQKVRTHKIDRTNEYRRTCVVLILQRAHLVSDGFALFAAVAAAAIAAAIYRTL